MSPDRSAGSASLQMQGVAKVDLPIDADAAAQRLAKAITFRTVSNQNRSDFDEGAFTDFHAYPEATFRKLHATLKREVLGAPRACSLLYTWTGRDTSLAPVVLMAHQDVVPVVPGTESEWEHDAYAGDVADGYVWGRGSLDDKIMILAIMEAVEMRVAEGFQPLRTTYLAFGQDEEVMGPEGAQHIAKVLQERGVTELALVIDEGLPITTGLFPGGAGPIALTGSKGKGYVTLELRVAGPGGALGDADGELQHRDPRPGHHQCRGQPLPVMVLPPEAVEEARELLRLRLALPSKGLADGSRAKIEKRIKNLKQLFEWGETDKAEYLAKANAARAAAARLWFFVDLEPDDPRFRCGSRYLR